MATTAEHMDLEVIERDERAQELSGISLELLERAQSIEITDPASDHEAAEFLAQVKTARKRWSRCAVSLPARAGRSKCRHSFLAATCSVTRSANCSRSALAPASGSGC